MRISEIIWLDDVVDKIEVKHHVTQREVEEVFEIKPKVKKMRRGYFRGEDVYWSFANLVIGFSGYNG